MSDRNPLYLMLESVILVPASLPFPPHCPDSAYRDGVGQNVAVFHYIARGIHIGMLVWRDSRITMPLLIASPAFRNTSAFGLVPTATTMRSASMILPEASLIDLTSR